MGMKSSILLKRLEWSKTIEVYLIMCEGGGQGQGNIIQICPDYILFDTKPFTKRM